MNYPFSLIRILDMLFSLLIIVVSSTLLIFIYLFLSFTSSSLLIYKERVGENLKKVYVNKIMNNFNRYKRLSNSYCR